jgi:hypothetical protein
VRIGDLWMGLRRFWADSGRTIDREFDERARQRALEAGHRALAVTVLVVLVATVALLGAPLSDRQRLEGFGLLPIAIIATFGVAWRVGRGGRALTPELVRAVNGRTALVWWPVASVVVGLLSLLALHRSAGDALVYTLTSLAGGWIGLLGYSWLARSR